MGQHDGALAKFLQISHGSVPRVRGHGRKRGNTEHGQLSKFAFFFNLFAYPFFLLLDPCDALGFSCYFLRPMHACALIARVVFPNHQSPTFTVLRCEGAWQHCRTVKPLPFPVNRAYVFATVKPYLIYSITL